MSPATSPGCILIFFSDFTSIVNDNVDNLIAKELLWLSASSTSSVWQQNCLHAAPLLWYQKARLKHHSRSNGKIFFTYSWCAFRDLDLEESGLWQGSFWVSDAGIICFVYTEINMSTSNLCKPFSRSIVGKHIVYSCTIFLCCLDDPYRDPNMNFKNHRVG